MAAPKPNKASVSVADAATPLAASESVDASKGPEQGVHTKPSDMPINKARGKTSFEEPASTATVRIARAEDELAEMKDPNQVNLVVPLDWPVSAILALTKSVIKQEQVERNIESEAEFKAPARSQAIYRLSEKWNVNGLENSYRVYRAKAEFEIEMTDQPLSWLEIGLRSGIAAAKHMGPGERAEHDFDRRKTLADVARRHYVKGKTYLQNSLTNQFP